MTPSQEMRARIVAGLRDKPPEDDSRLTGDFRLNPEQQRGEMAGGGEDVRDAAVLVPLVEHPGGITVLLTERSGDLSSHAGQVAFPGGRIDADDAGPAGAALREAQEEVGLDPARVEIAGYLDPYETGSRYRVVPVVGFVRPGFTVVPNPAEVDEAFEVPLAFLMDPANHERHSAMWQGRKRTFFAMPYEGHYIWGATAGMIVNLYERAFAAHAAAAPST